MIDEGSNHLGMELLADYAEQRLAPADETRVADHLSGCSACQAELNWLAAVTVALEPGAWQAPPRAARAKVRSAYRERMQPIVQNRRRHDLSALWQQALQALRSMQPAQLVRPAVVLGLSLFVYAISYVALSEWQASQVQAAVTSLISGDVQVSMAESAGWEPVGVTGEASQPVALQAGDSVVTGANSSLEIIFFEHSSAFLGEETEIAVQKLERRSRDHRIVLAHERGRVSVNVEAASGDSVDFGIETPSASIQVTGTRFTVAVGKDGTTEVAVEAGTVLVTAADSTRAVGAGERVVVLPGEEPVRVDPGSVPVYPEATPAISPTPDAPAVDGEKYGETKPERPPQANDSPGSRQDGEHAQPTRKPRPEQAQPHPTKKPLPTQVPPPARGQPPGLENRPNLENRPDTPARP